MGVVDRLADEMADVFYAPIVYYPGGWENSLPDDIKQQVVTERLLLFAQGEWNLATDAEVLCYLFTASLARPLDSDWTTIYIHTMAQWKPALRDTLDVPEELTNDQVRQLEVLKRQIRDTQKKSRTRRKANTASGFRGNLFLV